MGGLLRARPIRAGDVVRLVAPSSPFDREQFELGVGVLEGWGLRPRWRDDIFERRHYLAGPPRRRADELHEAFEDREASLILAVRGGYGVATLLPLLDPELVRRHPKVLVGCSDLTALLGWLRDRAGLVSLHGPMLVGLARGSDPEGEARLRSLLFDGGRPEPLRSSLPDPGAWCVSPGLARGPSSGGSLSLLAALCGTPHQPRTEGTILFLEDVGERPYRVDRMLTQIEQAGMLDGVLGVALGDFTGCDEPGGGVTVRDALDRVFRRRSIPVLRGLPFGHGRPNLVFPIGTQVQLDAGAGSVVFREEPLVR